MKTAKIFANGRSRAVRVPREWLGGAEEVTLRREGRAIVLEPLYPSLGELSERFQKNPIDLKRKRQSKTPPSSFSL